MGRHASMSRMRLADVLRPNLVGRNRIVDATPTGTDLRPILFLTTPVDYARVNPNQLANDSIGADGLVIASIGPDPGTDGELAGLVACLDSLADDGRLVLLLGWTAVDLPYRRLLPLLDERRCQVRQVMEIGDETINSVAVIDRVTRLQSILGESGRALIEPAVDDRGRTAVEIRLANEVAFGAYSERALRLAAAELATPLGQARYEADRARLQRRLEASELRASQLEAKIDDIEQSTSLEVGRRVVDAARSPKAAVRLPIDLVRAWRRR